MPYEFEDAAWLTAALKQLNPDVVDIQLVNDNPPQPDDFYPLDEDQPNPECPDASFEDFWASDEGPIDMDLDYDLEEEL